MSYELALEKAGCKIIDVKYFGSYQGDWLAFVEYEGKKGIVQGDYGSCSGCDAFEAEFGFFEAPEEKDGKYYRNGWFDEEITKEEYDQLMAQNDQRLADFGRRYLVGGLYDKAHYENKMKLLKEDDWFDEEEKEYCEWVISLDF